MYTHPTLHVSDVLSVVKRQFGDEAGIQITESDIIRWTNMAQMELFSKETFLKGNSTTNLLADQSVYDVSALNIMKIQSVHVNNHRINYISFQDAESYIVANDPERVSRGEPIFWTEWAGNVHVYPAPSADITGGMTIYYYPGPSVASASSDLLSIPDQYFNRIIEYCLSQAYELDEDLNSSKTKLDQFSQGVQEMRGHQQPQESYYPTITELPEDCEYY